jgi:hypothetical protein
MTLNAEWPVRRAHLVACGTCRRHSRHKFKRSVLSQSALELYYSCNVQVGCAALGRLHLAWEGEGAVSVEHGAARILVQHNAPGAG